MSGKMLRYGWSTALQGTTIAKKVSARSATELDSRIGSSIRQRRLGQKLTLEELASALNITAHQLQKYETGENRISASRLVDCGRVLGVHVAWFYQNSSLDSDEKTLSSTEVSLTSDERRLVKIYRALPIEIQSALILIVKRLSVEKSTS
jgi:transcriptional regulator with XRE-family HTH domain